MVEVADPLADVDFLDAKIESIREEQDYRASVKEAMTSVMPKLDMMAKDVAESDISHTRNG